MFILTVNRSDMKQIFTLLPALLFGIGVQAKTTSVDNTTSSVPVGGFFPHFGTQNNNIEQNKSSRLISKVHLLADGKNMQITDSVSYSYNNGDRGGATAVDDPNNDENILFDDSYTFIYDSKAGLYQNQLHRIQTFDNANNIQSLIYEDWNASTTQYQDSCQYSYTYNGNVMSESRFYRYIGNIWTSITHSLLYRDASENVVLVNSDLYKAYFSYDINNNLISVTDSSWDQSTGWSYNQRKTYVYDALNNVTSYTLEKWVITSIGNGYWEKSKRFTYTYNNQNLANAEEYNWNGSSWQLFGRDVYTYDNKHNKLSDTRQNWNALSGQFDNVTMKSWTYNSFNQPLTISTQTASGNSWYVAAGDDELRFTYEYYFPTSVPKLNNGENIKLYPCPAVNNITMSMQWSVPTDFTVSICDMTGKILKQWNEPAAKSYNKGINVSDMPSGNYVISAFNGNEQLKTMFTITR